MAAASALHPERPLWAPAGPKSRAATFLQLLTVQPGSRLPAPAVPISTQEAVPENNRRAVRTKRHSLRKEKPTAFEGLIFFWRDVGME